MSSDVSKTRFGKDIEMTADEINEFLAHSDNSDDDDNDEWNNLAEMDMTDFVTQNKENHIEESEVSAKKSTIPKKKDVGVDMLFSNPITKDKEKSSILHNDSDNEDVANDDRPYLSEYGAAVKEKLQSDKEAAYSKEIDTEMEKEAALKNRLKEMEEKRKRSIDALKTSQASVKTNNATVQPGDYFTAVPTRIRVIQPRISTELWESRTSDRLVLNVSDVIRQQKLQDLSSREWIAVGVVISKSAPLKSRKGSSYSIWKLNDLSDVDSNVSLFLFGRVHDDLWKESDGSVVALLKPKIMDSKEQANFRDDLSVTVDNSVQVLVLGHSLDVGVCLGTTKAGHKCTKIVNKCRSNYCDFHVKSAYKNATVTRPGFANITFPTFKNEAKRKSHPTSSLAVPPNSEMSLEPPEKKARLAKLTDVSLKSLAARPELSNNLVNWGLVDKETFTKAVKNKIVDTSGESSQKKKKSSRKRGASGGPESEESPLSNKKNLLTKKREEIRSNNEETFVSMLAKPSAGSMNFFKHLIKSEIPKTEESTTTAASSSSTAPHSQQSRKSAMASIMNKSNSFSSFFTNMAKDQSPCLGRGAASKGFVCLTSPPTSEKLRAQALTQKELMIRQKAIDLVKSKGGITNMKKVERAKQQNQIQKTAEVLASQKVNQNQSSSQNKTVKVNGLDLNSEELRRLLDKGSKHANLVDIEENKEQDDYFDKLAQKEQLEEKLISMHEQKVKVVHCKVCRYKALTASEQCKTSNHPLIRYEGVLRYFKCSNCKERTTTLERYPTIACKKCEGSSFAKTGMKPERKGPKMGAETLVVRGEERKWVNS